VREAGTTAEHMMLIGLGEPFMDPRIFERIEFCHRHSISTLLSTNGTFLDERVAARVLDSPLEQITLSFDGASKESFEFYRKGAKFEKVRDNFVRFARMKQARRSKTSSDMSAFACFWVSRGHMGQYRLHLAVVSTMYSTGSAASCTRRVRYPHSSFARFQARIAFFYCTRRFS